MTGLPENGYRRKGTPTSPIGEPFPVAAECLCQLYCGEIKKTAACHTGCATQGESTARDNLRRRENQGARGMPRELSKKKFNSDAPCCGCHLNRTIVVEAISIPRS